MTSSLISSERPSIRSEEIYHDDVFRCLREISDKRKRNSFDKLQRV